MKLADIAAELEKEFTILAKVEFRGEVTLEVNSDTLHDLLKYCHDKLAFDYLIDISSVDHFGDEPRFEIVYELSSLSHYQHLRIRVKVSEDHLEVPTATDIWPTADWHEREVYDMMGIQFSGHPDLRRILMWDDYPFYPLRKDFPLAGKETNVPGLAFTTQAPLEGGPFVTVPSSGNVHEREPRSRE